MRNIVMWGQYILFFMFFVGLSAGGLIVASAGRLFGVKAFKPITRLAVLEATVAVVLAATFILPDLGRPERILNIPLYFNPTSPMIWDITIVMVYMGLSATYVWLYARADLARRGSWLAFGTGTSERTMAREERAKSVMAWIALPAAILLHSITAWIFGLQIGRGFWYSSIMAPMFIASALVSGLGLVILLALLLRRLRPALVRRRPRGDAGRPAGHVHRRRGLPDPGRVPHRPLPGRPRGPGGRTDAVRPVPAAVPVRGGRRPGRAVPDPGDPAAAPAARHGWRSRPPSRSWASSSTASTWCSTGSSFPNIGLPPGLPIGVPQAGSSFAESYWYVPTAIEWMVVTGILAFGALLFTAAVLYLPMQEHEAH